jgi:hypothetical protein
MTKTLKIATVLIIILECIVIGLNPLLASLFIIGPLALLGLCALVSCSCDIEEYPIRHFWGAPICLAFFVFLLLLSANIIGKIDSVLVIFPLVGGFLFPFLAVSAFFKQKKKCNRFFLQKIELFYLLG